MAETYRGLKITIGADTTSLQKAIQATNSAITGTQNEIRKLSQALKLDPTSVDAAKLQVGALAEQAANTSTKVYELSQAMKQLEDKVPDGATQKLSEMAEGFKNVQMNASLATKANEEVTRTLSRMDTQLTAMLQNAGKDIVINVASNTTDMQTLAQSMLYLVENSKMALDDADKLCEQYIRLKKVFVDTKSEMDISKEVARYADLQSEVAKTEAQVKSLVNQLVQMGSTSDTQRGFGDLTQSLKEIDTYGEAAKARLADVVATLKAGTGDKSDLLADGVMAYSDALEAARLKVQNLQQQIAQYDDGEVRKMATSTTDLYEQTKLAEEAYRDALAQYMQYQSQINESQRQLDLLNAKQNQTDEDKSRIVELTDLINSLNVKLEQSGTEVDETRAKWQKFVEAGELRDKTEQLDAAKSTFEQLKDQGIDPATASVEQLSDALDVLNKADATPKIDEMAFMQAIDRMASAARQMAQEITTAANTIDSAYRDMRKTVNGTEEDFESIRASAIKFSQTHSVSADTLLEMEALGGQLGVTTEKLEDGRTALQAFGETTSNLDIATDINADTIALKLGQITNVMSDLDFTTFDNFADALVRLGNNVPATESAIMDVVQRISAVANVTNMSTPQLLAWGSAIASTGTQSESAATAITKTITQIGQAVADGGSKLQGFADIAHMSADEFKKAWETSSSDALEAFVVGLSKLTEPTTAAIEALDSVGIKSARQETSILALSQTINTLHDSMTMATDAFNGIDDKWGKAGDAAIEAQNKSQGFSGALAIMQNNAANLAASMGDGLIPLMEAASTIFSTLTDILNAIPAPVKTAVALFGGMTVAVSAIVPVIDLLAKGVSTVLFTMANTHGITEFVMTLTNLKDVMLGAKAAGANLSGVLSGMSILKFAGVTAAVAAFAALASAVMDAVEQFKAAQKAEQDFESASQRLSAAANGATGSSKSMSEGIKEISVSASEATEYIQSLADRIDAFAERMEGQNLELKVSTDTAEEAFSHIQELMDEVSQGAELNPAQQMELENAVALLNETLGTNIDVIDASKAKLSEYGDETGLTAQKLRELVDEEVRQAERSLLIQQYVAAKQELADLDDELSKKQADLTEAEGLYADAIQNTALGMNNLAPASRDALDANQGLYVAASKNSVSQGNLQREVDKASDAVERQRAVVEKLGDRLYDVGDDTGAAAEEMVSALTDAMEASEDLGAAIESLGGDVDSFDFSDFAQAFVEAGGDIDTFESLTASDLARVISAYDHTASSVRSALAEIGAALDDTSDKTKVTTEQYNEIKDAYSQLYKEQKRIRDDYYDNVKSSMDAEYDEVKRQMDRAYDDQKRYLDSVYDARKEELDNEYDLIKDSFDKEYDMQKSAYDKEYDAYKDLLDKEYDATKKNLDNIYSARKSELDKEYSALKKALDSEYDETKKHLDKVYDAKKSELDSAYSEEQRASQAYLKQYKRDLDAQTDAFKAATDERLHEMERERDAQKSLIEDELDRKTKEIEAQIKALKAETDAAEKAYNDKKAEDDRKKLQSAVDTAKSRKKQAEAQEKLDEFDLKRSLQLLKEKNEAEIDSLNEQKTALKEDANARKAALEAQYKEEVYQYKLMRSQLQEELQTSLDIQYEMEQANESRRLEALKAQQSATLEALKEENSEALELLKSSNEAELEIVKENNAAILENLKTENEAQLQAIKDDNEARLTELKDQQSASLQSMKDEQEAELQSIKGRNEAELSNLKQNNEIELQTIKDNNSMELENIKNENEAILKNLKRNHEDELDTIKSDYDSALEDLKNGVTTYDETLAKITGKTTEKLNDMANKVEDKAREVGDGAAKEFKSRIDQMLKDMQSVATDTMDILIHVFGSKRVNVAESTGEITGAFKAKLEEMKGMSREEAQNAIDAMEGEIGGEDAKSRLKTALQTTLDNCDDLDFRWAETSGYDLISNLVNGIYSGDMILGPALQWVADAIAAVLGHSVPKEGPLREGGKGEFVWGQHLVENIAEGILSMDGYLQDTISNVAANMRENMEFPTDGATEVVSSLLESLAGESERMGYLAGKGFSDAMTEVLGDGLLHNVARTKAAADEMSAMMSRSFDVGTVLDSALDAMERLRAATNRKMRDMAAIQASEMALRLTSDGDGNGGNAIGGVTINLTMQNVTFSDRSDIDYFTREMQRKVERATKGRIS